LDSGIAAICGLALASALIHVQAAIDHFEASQLEAALFILLANAQLAWGILVYKSADATLLWVGAGASVLVAGAWAMSRTIGIPIGPHPWAPEPVGMIDLLATLDELLLALAVVMRWSRARGAAARVLRATISGAAVALLLLSSLELAGFSGHVH
jgi:hypothetical protein